MRVIYAKPINERLDEAIVEAKKDNKKIEKFVLTEEEFDELKTWSGRFCYYATNDSNANYCYNGVRVEKLPNYLVDF